MACLMMYENPAASRLHERQHKLVAGLSFIEAGLE